MKTALLLAVLALLSSTPRADTQVGPHTTPSAKIPIVGVTGCLKEATPNTWTLTAATDPAPSSANAPAAKEIPSTPPPGKNSYRLIGVSEFNLPAHRDHTVVIKGLFIKAEPTSRVNMTSVTDVSPSCVAAPK